MANTSSSSSFQLSTSSSSKDSTSSSTISISSFSSKSTSSASSISTSSSSSIDSSTSSSSSLFEIKGERVMPFLWSSIKRNDVNCFVYNQNYCFAGMSGKGEVIVSSNRYHWTKYFDTNDYSAKTLFVENNYLFVASAPKGKIYKINMNDNSFVELQELNEAAVAFFKIQNSLYLCATNNIYLYNPVIEKFLFYYKTYGNITNIYAKPDNVLIGMEKENIISFDGKNFTLLTKGKNTISSVRNISTNPFSKVSFNFIQRDKIKNFSKDEYMSIVPYNKESGIFAIIEFENNIIAGGKNFARVFSIDKSKFEIDVIFDTDEAGIKSMMAIDSKTILVATGESLYLAFWGKLSNPTIPGTSVEYKDKTVNVTFKDSERQWYFVKVMSLQNEFITTMSTDAYYNQVLLGTSKGRILSTDNIKLNAYATGHRTIYANVKNEYGKNSNISNANLLYSLHKRCVEINENKKIEKWKFSRMAAINKNEKITGVFISPIIDAKNDFGFWNTLIWEENKNENDKIRIFLKSAESINKLYLKDWQFGFESKKTETGTITRSLNNIKLEGNYLQIKVEMECASKLSMLSKISVEYSTKNASYFYTTNFEMETDKSLTKGLITANIVQNPNTEIIFGVANKNTSNWNDFQIVEKDKFFSLENFEDIKIGVKLVSYGDNLPQVSEFALMRSK